MKGRHTCSLANFTCEIEVWCGLHPLDRDQIGHGWICMYASLDHVEKVDLTCGRDTFGNFQTFVMGDTAFLCFVRRVAKANDELCTNAFADCVDYVQRESHAVFQRISAVRSNQIVGQRRPELIEQVAVDL